MFCLSAEFQNLVSLTTNPSLEHLIEKASDQGYILMPEAESEQLQGRLPRIPPRMLSTNRSLAKVTAGSI